MGFIDYLSEIENYFDLSALFVITIYNILTVFDLGSAKVLANVLCLGVLLSNARLMFHLTVFSSSFRTMITVIVKAMIQLSSFLVILVMFVYILAIS